MEKYFCIFGGGGIRGAAYTGVLEALSELNIELTGCAGSSIGAVVAGLYTIGYSADEIREVFNNINMQLFNDLNFNFGKDFALSRGENFYLWIKNKLEEKFWKNGEKKPVLFRDVDKELVIFSVNLVTSKFHEFSKNKTPDVEIAHAIRVSVGMPGLYTPVLNEDECLVDGDLLKAMPLWMASSTIQKNEKILELRLENNETRKKITNTVEYLNAVYDSISGFASDFIIKSYGVYEKYDYVKINTEGVSVVDFMADKNKKTEMEKTGYSAVIDYFKNKYPKKKEKIDDVYNYINSSIKRIEFFIKNQNLKEAKYLIADVLSSEVVQNSFIDKKIIDMLYSYKKLFNENYAIKKGLLGQKEILIDKNSVINMTEEILSFLKSKLNLNL